MNVQEYRRRKIEEKHASMWDWWILIAIGFIVALFTQWCLLPVPPPSKKFLFVHATQPHRDAPAQIVDVPRFPADDPITPAPMFGAPTIEPLPAPVLTPVPHSFKRDAIHRIKPIAIPGEWCARIGDRR